jgi:acetyl-CoA carboxylase biotin carboxyl carrier protein
MDLNEIKKILELMDSNKVVELEFEEEGKKIRLRRAEERHANNVPVIAPMAVPAAMPVAAVAPQAAAPAPAAVAAPKRPDNIVEIKAPLVGTFYRAPKPDADPFVNVGDEVQPEKVLCIVEAMKVMNEIKAEMHGVVREILVKNGQAVEFGELMFLVEKK